MRYVAVDPGTRRSGLAVWDTDGGIPLPAGVVEHGDDAAGDLADAARQLGADVLVVGLPRNADGSEGPAARAARHLAMRLARMLGLLVGLLDERYTTAAALQALEGRTPSERARLVDTQAAVELLERLRAGEHLERATTE